MSKRQASSKLRTSSSVERTTQRIRKKEMQWEESARLQRTALMAVRQKWTPVVSSSTCQ